MLKICGVIFLFMSVSVVEAKTVYNPFTGTFDYTGDGSGSSGGSGGALYFEPYQVSGSTVFLPPHILQLLFNGVEASTLTFAGSSPTLNGPWVFKATTTLGNFVLVLSSINAAQFVSTGGVVVGFSTIAAIGLSPGLVGIPSIYFAGDRLTGPWRSGTDQWGFTVSGVNKYTLSSSGLTMLSNLTTNSSASGGVATLTMGASLAGFGTVNSNLDVVFSNSGGSFMRWFSLGKIKMGNAGGSDGTMAAATVISTGPTPNTPIGEVSSGTKVMQWTGSTTTTFNEHVFIGTMNVTASTITVGPNQYWVLPSTGCSAVGQHLSVTAQVGFFTYWTCGGDSGGAAGSADGADAPITITTGTPAGTFGTPVSSGATMVLFSSPAFTTTFLPGATVFVDISTSVGSRTFGGGFYGSAPGTAIRTNLATDFSSVPIASPLYTARITSFTITATSVVGEIRVNVKKKVKGAANSTWVSICADACPSLSGSTQEVSNWTLAGWDTTISGQDQYMLVVDTAATGVDMVTVALNSVIR